MSINLRVPRPRAGFPWTAPTWPGGAERPPVERTLGVDYETAWARRYGARLGRVVVTEGVTRPLVRLLAAPKVDGLDRLTMIDEPVIFAANHASHIDTPLVLSVLPDRWRHRTVVAAGADYFFDRRWKAALFAFGMNAIPIERLRVNRRSADLAASVLDDGWSLLIFPEGGRTPDGWGQTHRPGAAWLAVRTNRAVVPVYVEGTRRVLPRHGNRLRPATTRVSFGQPIRPVPGIDARALAVTIEQALGVLADEQVTDWWTARRRAAQGTTPALTGPPGARWRRAWALTDGSSSRGGPRRGPRPGPRRDGTSADTWPRF
jgi:1-acyl-sn-glycerol-3-phosphate acyltransferase